MDKCSICIFLHYFPLDYIPLYVRLYIKNLDNYFDKVLFVYNKRDLDDESMSFINQRPTLMVNNEGYDFGMFYKAIQNINLSDYNTIACINDSNFIINDLQTVFDWAEKQSTDFWGLIDSNQSPGLHKKGPCCHVQSHFIVFREKAIELIPHFFESLDIDSLLKEKDLRLLRKKIIAEWEVGFSQFLLKKGLTYKTFIDSNEYSKKLNSKNNKNISIVCYDQLIKDGYPVIKRHIISHPKIHGSDSWKKLLRKYGNPEWDIELLIMDMAEVSSIFKRKSFFKRLLEKIRGL